MTSPKCDRTKSMQKMSRNALKIQNSNKKMRTHQTKTLHNIFMFAICISFSCMTTTERKSILFIQIVLLLQILDNINPVLLGVFCSCDIFCILLLREGIGIDPPDPFDQGLVSRHLSARATPSTSAYAPRA